MFSNLHLFDCSQYYLNSAPSVQNEPGASSEQPLPSPPQQLNESSAESFAVAHERVRLTNRLSESYANDSFGVDCCTAPKLVSTATEQSGIYYVRVQYPYYYETADAETDAATHSMYIISQDNATRIDLRERVISVEDPYGAVNSTDNAAAPRLYLVNAVDGDRDVSLRLTHLGSGDTAFDRSIDLDTNTSVAVSQVAYRKGDYQLTVSVDGSTSQHRFTITESSGSPIFAVLTADDTTIRRVPEPTNTSTESE